MLKHHGNACFRQFQQEMNTNSKLQKGQKTCPSIEPLLSKGHLHGKANSCKMLVDLHDSREIIVAEVSFLFHLIAKQIQTNKTDEVDIC